VASPKRTSGARALGGALGGRATGEGAVIYAGACAMCHEPTGQLFSARGIPLASSKVLTMPDPRNLAHVILGGIAPPFGTPAALMPGFADALTDQQITALMVYLRGNFTDEPPWGDVAGAVRKAKQNAAEELRAAAATQPRAVTP
jgi:mono/diheme cytochrome c family protein